MKVAELAEEWDLPISIILDRCEQLGIADAAPDAELSETDEGMLRAELVSGATPQAADAAAEPVPAASGMSRGRTLRSDRGLQLDAAARRAAIAGVVAIVALVLGEVVDRDYVIAILWFVAAVAVVVAIWSGIRGLRRVRQHPNSLTGAGLALGALGASALAGVILLVSVFAVVGSAPAADAPLGLGDRSSVATARWGYQRVRLAAAHDWKTPGKPEATCWTTDSDAVRDPDRVESGSDQQDCEGMHNVQIMELYRYDTEADSPFPGPDAIQQDVIVRCSVMTYQLLNPEGQPPITGLLVAEHPTEAGWAKGDRDITCALVTGARRGQLR